MDRPKLKKLDERFKWTFQYRRNKDHNQLCKEWEEYHEHIMKANNTCPIAY